MRDFYPEGSQAFSPACRFHPDGYLRPSARLRPNFIRTVLRHALNFCPIFIRTYLRVLGGFSGVLRPTFGFLLAFYTSTSSVQSWGAITTHQLESKRFTELSQPHRHRKFDHGAPANWHKPVRSRNSLAYIFLHVTSA